MINYKLFSMLIISVAIKKEVVRDMLRLQLADDHFLDFSPSIDNGQVCHEIVIT